MTDLGAPFRSDHRLVSHQVTAPLPWSRYNRERRAGQLRSHLVLWSGAAGVAAVAWAVRALGITVNYDIFIDETTYARIAENLATGRGLTLYGAPFDLHPPAGLAMMAAAIKVFSMHGSLATVLFDLRPFVASLGALTCVLVFFLVGRLTSWATGLAAAVIVVLDPFEISYDSRVMLEAPAQLAAAGSILLLTASMGPARQRWSWLLAVCGGLAGGIALCAKEDFGLVLAGMLVFVIAFGWALERTKAVLALGIMLGSYVLSQLLVVLTGGLGAWQSQVGSGLLRMIGVQQTSGFNAPGVHVSIVSRLSANATHFGVTYLILGLGAVAGGASVISAIRHRARRDRGADAVTRGRLLVAVWAVAAGGYLVYATAFGTIEEQMYYVLLVPALCALVIWCHQNKGQRSWAHWGKLCAVGVVLVLIADGAVWAAVHRARDDTYRQLLSWAPRHLPSGTTVSVTEGTAQFILPGVTPGQWSTVPQLVAHHVDYVLVSTSLVSQGYGIASMRFERYLEGHGKIVWEAAGPTSGALILFDVRALTGAR